jgi:DNA-binding NarL/FixJ family response regulator
MLSSREQEIFELLVSGRSPDNIASHLVLSLNTVRTHIRNIYAKFDVHNKTELVSYVETILKE